MDHPRRSAAHRTAEHARLAQAPPRRPGEWKTIGPWLAERAWGTVREDYSPDGRAWEYFPYEQARSRAYRWSEDGLAGVCDIGQRLCLALAFWNGRDPFLKERLFGLGGHEGNHGEDVKEYWWYVDATPTASWLRWRYHYPQAEFPYAQLRAENARRGRDDPEFELLDTGIFDDDRYWRIEADYAKASPRDLGLRLRLHNAGPEAAVLHVLPTLWFRNRWSWDAGRTRPVVRAETPEEAKGAARAVAEEHGLGRWRLVAGPDPAGRAPRLLFCENDTNFAGLYGAPATTAYPKDGINDHVVSGAATVNPAREGSKLACWYRLEVGAGETAELRLRLAQEDAGEEATDLGAGFEATFALRQQEADEFYAALRPEGTSDAEAALMRQGFAGSIWSHQFYHYDVARWLAGDPTQPPPPAERRAVRNGAWQHLENHDVLGMPDKWEYPWYAAWDLAFHCVVLAHIDPAAAKHQLLLLCREWYMHPNGQLPGYEWSFDNVNPPIHAWAALAVFRIDGGRDFDFLARAFHKLLINFTWWVNRKDAFGDNIFEGGFLGLDNVGPFDRSAVLPGGEMLEQCDGTAWMGKFCLDMLEMALRLAQRDHAYEAVALKFFEHFAYLARAMDALWDEEDGFYYDRVRKPDGTTWPLRARSAVGLVPLFASVRLGAPLWEHLHDFRERARWFLDHKPELSGFVYHHAQDKRPEVLALVSHARLLRVLARALDEEEFLSPWGLRSLSRHHRDHPLVLKLDGVEARLDYEPAESRCGLFGGNSNWRGPVWLPLNYLAIESLRHLFVCLGDGCRVDLPRGSGVRANLGEVADELERRLIRLFLADDSGRRPLDGGRERFACNPAWRDPVLFYEYFHGDTGEGLGASHQSGWSALVGALIADRGNPR